MSSHGGSDQGLKENLGLPQRPFETGWKLDGLRWINRINMDEFTMFIYVYDSVNDLMMYDEERFILWFVMVDGCS